MEITEEGFEYLEREDYFGFVTSVSGYMFATIRKDQVDVEIKTEEGVVVASQSYTLDVLSLLEKDENIAIGSTDLVTKLYLRNMSLLLKSGKGAFHFPSKDGLFARLFNWLYKLTTKEKYDGREEKDTD